jgi:Ran GTPase-activating protein (RanGAP) involved in mRNA processing and transport
MGPKGSVVLAKALATNHTLTVLNVQGNAIKDEGFTSLAQALMQNTSIKE